MELDGKQLMKVKDGQSGYLSPSDMPLDFGLNAAKQVSKVEVVWPNGKKQIVAGPVKANQTLTVTEK